jgi:hypothetical protein
MLVGCLVGHQHKEQSENFLFKSDQPEV